MNEQNKAFGLGLFIIVALALIAWLIFFLKPQVGDEGLLLTVRFTNIDKIMKGTRVTYGGKPVGQVKEICPISNPRKEPANEFGTLFLYELILEVDSSVKIYSYDQIIFATSGLLGDKSITIIPKAAPPGAPPPIEITHEVLYGQSTDKLEQALDQLTDIADTFDGTMEKINVFLNENRSDFRHSLNELGTFLSRANEIDTIGKASKAFSSIESAMAKAEVLFSDMNNIKFVDKIDKGFSYFQDITERLQRGEGTLGKLLSSDCFYLQVTAMLAKFETVLSDIANYGLLFQYDKCWQRRRMVRTRQMYSLQTPCDFYNFFDQEVSVMNYSLSRTEELFKEMQCRQIPISNECFTQSFIELLCKLEQLQNVLKHYTEMWTAEYCQKCSSE